MKIYLTYEGVDHYGYTILGPEVARYEKYTTSGFFDETAANRMKELTSLVDSSLVPPKGSSVNVIQNCALPVAAIRNNYTIKRGYDTADYNVFSPLNFLYGWNFRQILLYPKEKLALTYGSKTTSLREAADDLQLYVPDIPIVYDNCILIQPASGWLQFKRFNPGVNEEAWCAFLEGKLKKPCVSYTQLDLTTDNVLTTDTLYIIYNLGMKPGTYEDADKLAIQIKALEQMNIDLYPGTMSLINSIFKNARRTTGNYVYCHKGSSNKTVKRLLSMNKEPKTDVDYQMGQAFMETILRMKDIKFTDMITLQKKLETAFIPIESFMGFYDNMVKITKKTANE